MRFSLFENNSKLLPAFCKPYQDEALGSWLTRLSYGHGMTRSGMLRHMGFVNDTFYTQWSLDRHINDQQVKIMARYTNSTASEIWNSTVRCYENSLFEAPKATTYSLSLWTVKRNRSVMTRAKSDPTTLYCPCCFAKEATPVYYKKDWQLIVSFVCMDCKCYLRERCPHCKNGPSKMNLIERSAFRNSIDEYFVTCRTCKKNVSDCDPVPAPKHIIQLQKKINKCLRGNQLKYTSLDYFKALYKISCLLVKSTWSQFNPLVSKVFRLYDVADFRDGDTALSIQKLTVKKQADIFYMADQLLREWPNPFTGLISRYNLYGSELLEYFSGMPDWIIKPLEDHYERFPGIRKPKTYDYNFESHLIDLDCSRKSDYDFNPDEDYYNRAIDDLDCNIFPRKSQHNANDLLYYQMKKACKW